jgi:hypothetical protein
MTTKLPDPFETPAAFRAWLMTHAGYETVGYRRDVYDSPDARYLRHVGHVRPAVTGEQWWCYCEGHIVTNDLPGWAYRLIGHLDAIGEPGSHGPITRDEAIAALDFVESGMGTAGLEGGLVAGAARQEGN